MNEELIKFKNQKFNEGFVKTEYEEKDIINLLEQIKILTENERATNLIKKLGFSDFHITISRITKKLEIFTEALCNSKILDNLNDAAIIGKELQKIAKELIEMGEEYGKSNN